MQLSNLFSCLHLQRGRDRWQVCFGTKKYRKTSFFFTIFYNFTEKKELNLLYLF